MKTRRIWITAFAALVMAAIVGGCKDDNLGTVGVCPLVVSTNPANSATGVPLEQVITVTFNEAMNPSTITPAAFSLSNTGLAARVAGSASGLATIVPGTLSYNGADFTMRFVPSTRLTAGTKYSATVAAVVKDLKGNALQVDYTWTFGTGALAAPTITTTDPLNAATGVVLNKKITATFNSPMSPLTINTSTFTLKAGTAVIASTVSYTGLMATLVPTAALTANTLYTATVTNGAKNAGGINLTTDYAWTFTTGTLSAPKVNSTDPLDLASAVPLNKIISATFSEAMDPLTITSTTFVVTIGSTPVAGTVAYSGTIATFTPSGGLTFGKNYTATITTGAKNVAGTPIANPFIWNFSTSVPPTVTLTDPLNLATGVALNKTITATFSEPMDPLTITGLTFKVQTGGSSIAGNVTYSGTTATFAPTGNLLSGTTYTATITTGAKNPGGIAIASDVVWDFSTVAPLGPLVVDLKSVARFGIIAGVGVSNNAGFSVINNLDVGIYPGLRSSITGFPPAIIVNGAMYASDDIAPPGIAAMLLQAKNDLTAAYLFAEGATSPAPATVSGDQGGLTLAPGIYKSTSTLLIQSGNLTLDAQGDANAVWIFQIASAFTTVGGAGGSVILSGGAQAKNIFWQTGSSATIGDNTTFKGNVLALTSITMNANATATGRMLARNGSVVMTSTNTINKP